MMLYAQPKSGGYGSFGGAYKPMYPSGPQQQAPQGGVYNQQQPKAKGRGVSPGDVYKARRDWKAAGGQGDWGAYLPNRQTGGYQNAPDPMDQRGPMGGFGAYSSAAPQDKSHLLNGGWGGPQQGSQQYAMPQYQQPQGGFSAQYGQIGGGYGASPDFAQRDAFINNINDTMAGYQANQGTYLGSGSPPATWGQPPQFNFPAMWQQAGDMVQNGWKNPLLGLLG